MRARVGLDRELLKDLAARLGVEDVVEWIEEEATRLARLGWDKREEIVRIGRRLRLACGIVGIERGPKDMEGIARIVPAGWEGGFSVTYRPGVADARLRFALAHEVGHTLWWAKGTGPGPPVPVSPLQRTMGSDPTIEYLCNRFAAALLLPRPLVMRLYSRWTRDLPEDVLGLHLIPVLARRFRVDEQLVGRRLVSELLRARVILLAVSRSREHWHTRWICGWNPRGTLDGIRQPAITSSRGRVVPDSWIPGVRDATTTKVDLPVSWRLAFKRASPRDRQDPFPRTHSSQETIQGMVARVGTKAYVAIAMAELGTLSAGNARAPRG